MQKIFSADSGFHVPDGTIVHSIVDPRMTCQTGVEWVDACSLAQGVIPEGVTSKIHVHPIVTQCTYVLSGRLSVRMKDPRVAEPYLLALNVGETVVTRPGTFFQLINPHHDACKVLYIVAPAFLFDADETGVRYNDAIVLEASWEALATARWHVPQLKEISNLAKDRAAAIQRLRQIQHNTL
ncbi:MAG: cupin domain-containing protein [Deltaproteobacteria bacterium]|nr:cupin domain-containing protein [Deltaproteobacteria bacterium]